MGQKSVNQTAAFLLGVALRRLFPHKKYPHIEYLGSSSDLRSFQAQIFDTEPFEKEWIPLIEKEMKNLLDRPIHVSLMLIDNAKEMLKHYGQEGVGQERSGQGGRFLGERGKAPVCVAQMDGWFDLVRSDCSKDLGPPLFLHLTHFTQEESQRKGERGSEKGHRIVLFGRAFSQRKECQDFGKKWRHYGKTKHQKIAKDLDLYEGNTWYPRGMVLRHVLIDLQKTWLDRLGFSEVLTQEPSLYSKQRGIQKIFSQGVCHYFEEESLSSLAFSMECMRKWIRRFPLEYLWVIRGRKSRAAKKILEAVKELGDPFEWDESQEGSVQGDTIQGTNRLDLCLFDRLGLLWPVASLWPTLDSKKRGTRFSLIEHIEPFIACLLEQTYGDLPLWLVPEQMRILTTEEVDYLEIQERLARMGVRCAVDAQKLPLKEKVYRALRVKVPYVIFFGKQEEKAKEMSIRAFGSSQNSKMTSEQLKQFVLEHNFASQ